MLALTLFAGIGLGVVIATLRTEPFGIVVVSGRVERIMDFASHRAFACAAWRGGLVDEQSTSIYTVEAHLNATARWSGFPATIALPFGYSPTMLWVLAPFCVVPQRPAFAAWSFAGLIALGGLARRARVGWPTLLALLTPVTVYTLALGQTALLTTAGLLCLILADRKDGLAPVGTAVIVLWLLTIKPPLATAAGVALLARRRWMTVVGAGAVALVATAALGPRLGPTWIRDYTDLLANYDRTHLPTAFAWSITPELMSNFRAALHVDMGVSDGLAVRASAAMWAASIVGLLLATRRRRLSSGAIWSASVLAFLLFCPHLSPSEDLALFCVPVALGKGAASVRLRGALVVLVVGGLVLSPALGPLGGRRPSVLFFAKVVLATCLVAARLGH